MASALVRRGDLASLINLWAPQRLSDSAASLQKRPVWGLVGCVCGCLNRRMMAKLSQFHIEALLVNVILYVRVYLLQVKERRVLYLVKYKILTDMLFIKMYK